MKLFKPKFNRDMSLIVDRLDQQTLDLCELNQRVHTLERMMEPPSQPDQDMVKIAEQLLTGRTR